MRATSRCLAAAALFGIFVADAEARADSKQECAAAYEKTQILRDEGKLVEARGQAIACSASTCSVYVVKDCSQWLVDLDARLPTILLTAEDAAGVGTLAVRVKVDGQLVAKKLGKVLPINPGAHVLRFEMDGAEAIEQRLSVHAGAKDLSIMVSFKKALPVGPPAVVPPEPAGPPAPVVPLFEAAALETTPSPVEPVSPSSDSAVPLWAWASLGAGAVAAGVGVGFGVSGLKANGAVTEACGGDAAHCPVSKSTAARPFANQRSLDRDVVIGLGAAAAVGLGVGMLGLVRARSPAVSPRAGFVVAPFGSPRGGGLSLQGDF